MSREQDNNKFSPATALLGLAAVGIGLGLAYFASEEEPAVKVERSSTSIRKPALEDHEEMTLKEWVMYHSSQPKEAESKELFPERLCCPICMVDTRRVSQVFACGHGTCLKCALDIIKSNNCCCPFDRKPITKPPRPFLL